MPGHGSDHSSLFPRKRSAAASPGSSVTSEPVWTGQNFRKGSGQNFRSPQVVAAGLLTWAVLLRAGSPTFILKLDRGGIYFVIAVIGLPVLFYLLTGLGVLFPSTWGYRLLTAFLYVHLFVGFPITTFFAYRGLSYIKSPSIKNHFGAPVRANEPTTLTRRAKVIIALIGAAMIALWIWVMLTA